MRVRIPFGCIICKYSMDATDCGIVGSVSTKTKISVTSTATAHSWARGAAAQHLKVEGLAARQLATTHGNSTTDYYLE
ncbi:unnamed protein product [Pieris macdunnoughi]|uniref:Uncharacterized protein n=1 Tax=Pieris macdunnoughi TaxID=345717 RepID=A0A821S184_9NEOP|nr:unnamed protein product [Pieris macdunnoughi]